MATGRVVKLVRKRGFGFIREEGLQQDLFFHRPALKGANFSALPNLSIGMRHLTGEITEPPPLSQPQPAAAG